MNGQPSKESERFSELVTFLSHVAPCYKEETNDLGAQLKSLLEQHGPILVRRRSKQANVPGMQHLGLQRQRWQPCLPSSSGHFAGFVAQMRTRTGPHDVYPGEQ